MHETLYDPYHLVQDHIDGLYATARETHVRHSAGSARSGLLTRSRMTIGRSLVSIGTAVAGPRASTAGRPSRAS